MCGILGVITPKNDAFNKAFIGLSELQHRGQEAAGISILLNNGLIKTYKNFGLVQEALSKYLESGVVGHAAIAHTRYSTHGDLIPENVQPIQNKNNNTVISLAHNGNIVNWNILSRFTKAYDSLGKISDSNIILGMLTELYPELSLECRILKVMPLWQGAYNLVLLSGDKLLAVRDPLGFRPLVYGQLKDGGYVIASEIGALNALDCRRISEIQPGCVYIFDRGNFNVIKSKMSKKKLALCTFEHIYFSREDNIWDGLRVGDTRFRLGQEMAKEASIDADFITPIPSTANNAARGYANITKLDYLEIIEVNKLLGRTFIQPSMSNRIESVENKYKFNKTNITGKHIVLVDDSLVRGTTMKILIDRLRRAGAAKIHVRIACPPILHPCFMGINIPSYSELIAANNTLKEIEATLNVDTIKYLSLEGMTRAIGSGTSYCNACFTGKYPNSLEGSLSHGLV